MKVTRVEKTASSIDSDQLLDDYRRGDFFLATAERTLLGRGAVDTFTDRQPVRLSESVAQALVEMAKTKSGQPIAVGVLPFDTGPKTTTPGHIVLPRSLSKSGPIGSKRESAAPMPVGKPSSVDLLPDPGDHVKAVSTAIAELSRRRMRKVVLARALDLEFDEPVSAESILHNLVKDNTGGYTFAAPLSGGRTFLGASPELLVQRRGRTVVSHPHAGSAPRSADPVADAENAKTLERSKKDREEHAVLTEAVVEAMRPFCRKLNVPSEPSIVSTSAVWHLGTTVTGELRDRNVTALHLATQLHPTPAICGTPTEYARDLAVALEPFDRGYYAGAVGWVDASGDGDWAVAIRCAELRERTMRLYAGGGIVPASDGILELAETSAKFQVLLHAMGLNLELSA